MRKLLAVLSLILMTGCSTSTHLKSSIEPEQLNLNGVTLNGELRKNASTNEYYFDNLSFDYNFISRSRRVSLTNLYLSGMNFEDTTCIKSIWGGYDGGQCPASNDFRNTVLDPLRTTGHIPIQLLSSLGFRIFAPQYVLFSNFDDDEFVTAYNSAILNLKAAGIEKHIAEIKSYIETQNSAAEEQQRATFQAIKKQPKIIIDDKSKIFNERDLLNERITIEKNLDLSSLPTIEDIQYSDSVEDMKRDYERKLTRAKTRTIRSNVKCDFWELTNRWNIKQEGCQSQDTSPTVKITIESKKASYYLPSIELSNRSLDIEFIDGDIKVHNKTNSYIDINTLTLYFNRDVKTQQIGELELPPNSIYTVARVSSFDNVSTEIDVEETYKNHRKDKFVDFGFAVKYRSADTGEYYSFYESKQVKYLPKE